MKSCLDAVRALSVARPTSQEVGGLKSKIMQRRAEEDGPTSQEVGGLKFRIDRPNHAQVAGPTSQEVGGLKCTGGRNRHIRPESHLAGGGWIEMDIIGYNETG